MKHEEIIRMANVAGGDFIGAIWEFTPEELERFFNLAYNAGATAERNRTWTQEHWTDYERSIASAEREACAKLCESIGGSGWSDDKYRDGANDCADAIKARSKQA